MYLLTKAQDTLNEGAYATLDVDGSAVIQFFVNRDDAVSYNTQLEALGQGLYVTEIQSAENIDKLCEYLGYSYSVVEPGQYIVPRIETINKELDELL